MTEVNRCNSNLDPFLVRIMSVDPREHTTVYCNHNNLLQHKI